MSKNIVLFLLPLVLVAQVDETLKRYVKIGSLQSHYSAYGSERAWNNTYYEGLIWPADYLYQDNAVIKRSWMACKDFTDSDGYAWGHYGLYFVLSVMRYISGINMIPNFTQIFALIEYIINFFFVSSCFLV